MRAQGRAVAGFLILIFTLVVYYRLAEPEFLEEVGVTGNLTKEQVKFYITFFQPVILLSILTAVVAIIFPDTKLPVAIMIAITGLIAYFTFTSQWFFSIIGFTNEEQLKITTLLSFLSPIIICALIISVAFVVIKMKD